MLLFGLSASHKLGIALMAAVLVGFSLTVSLLVPKRWPQFPGRHLPIFLVVCVLLVVGMLSAIVIFGRESSSEAASAGTTPGKTTSSPAKKISVTETEFKIQLPKTSIPAGNYLFAVSNNGKLQHDLTIAGPGTRAATPTIPAGGRSSVTVQLAKGTYDFYCSIPGHKAAGMDVKVTVT